MVPPLGHIPGKMNLVHIPCLEGVTLGFILIIIQPMLKYVLYVDCSIRVFDQKFVQIFHLMLSASHVTYLDPLIDI